MLVDWRALVPANALVVGALIVGLANSVLIASEFGLTHRVDAFYAAMMLPNLFMLLCADYLGKNFLPMFALARKEGDHSASAMVSTIVTIVLLLATLTMIILIVFSSLLFGLLLPGFDDAETGLVSRYFWIMAPATVLMAANSIHEYVCHHDDKFVNVFAIRTALPVTNLVSILVVGPLVGEYCLPIGYLAGHAIVFVLVARQARYEYSPMIKIRPHLERKILANSAIVMSTGILARTKSIVANALASSLGGGAIAALAFAAKLTEPLERGAFAAAKVFMFSRAARLFADRNDEELVRLYGVGLRVSCLLLTPLIWWIALNSGALVELVFARGEFTPEMTTLVAGTLLALVPSVFFVGVGQLLANGFYAMNRVKVPALVMLSGMVVHISAAVPLSALLGTQGIAAATTVTSVVVFVALLVCLSRRLVAFPLIPVSTQMLGYAALGGIAMISAAAILQRLSMTPVFTAITGLLVGMSIYIMVLVLVRDRTLSRLSSLARGWLITRTGHRATAP